MTQNQECGDGVLFQTSSKREHHKQITLFSKLTR